MTRPLRSSLASAVQTGLLVAAHQQGQRRPRLAPEAPSPALLARAASLRAASLAATAGRHAKSRHRVLLCTPPSVAAAVWFSDLEQGLVHQGVACTRLPAGASVGAALLDDLRPTVLVALDHSKTLAALDLPAVERFKARHGLTRLFVPTRTRLFALQETLDEEEAHRLEQARNGHGADAFVSLYVPELYSRAWAPWAQTGLRYLSLPQACNPLQDLAVARDRVHAWFFCSANNPDRLRSVAGLLPLLRRHPGDWAGEGWRLGGPVVPFEDMPARYAGARVALAPLVRFLRDHPAEITHRVFEAAACGAFQVTHRTPVTNLFFPEGTLVAADTDAAFVETVEAFLPDAEARNRMALRTLEHVYAHHTVFARAERLLQWLDDVAPDLGLADAARTGTAQNA